MKPFTTLWDWVDKRGVVRRIVLGVAIVMTWNVTVWAMHYATTCALPGLELAAVITAVTAPVTLFGGFVFKAYIESRAI